MMRGWVIGTTLAILLSCLPVAAEESARCMTCSVPCRTTLFTYAVKVENVAPGAQEAVLYLPIPQDSEQQTISDLKVNTGGTVDYAAERRHGNKVVKVVFSGKALATPTAEITFLAHRKELKPDLRALEGKEDPQEDLGALAEFLKADRLVLVDDEMKAIATKVVAGKTGTIAKAKAIYDYVLGEMKYSKDGEGWGKGSTVWALEKKYGNCTDFHALFISLSRAAGIPARFDMGVPLPTKDPQGTVGGYHCWAFFYVPATGWVPVDISEADKNPVKAAYFFGAIDADRITFSTGRDLEIGQKGEPLNFFIYPYVEVDGKAHTQAKREFRYADRPAKSG